MRTPTPSLDDSVRTSLFRRNGDRAWPSHELRVGLMVHFSQPTDVHWRCRGNQTWTMRNAQPRASAMINMVSTGVSTFRIGPSWRRPQGRR
jgi:hypothetical protein